MAILVVGAGIMGRGIAFVAAVEAERDVVLVDANPKVLDDAAAYFRRNAERFDLDPQVVSSRIQSQPSIEAACRNANIEFAIEAVPEKLELKKVIFNELAQYTGPRTVLASNTSSIPITQIAESIGPKERVVGMHFFNPVPRMPGLEVIRTKYTDESVVERTLELGNALGKKVTLCQKDIAGFLVNRILNATMLEAVSLLERGAGTPKEIDRIMKYAAGSPMGPFRLADLVGLDTVHALMHVVYEDSGRDARYKPSPILDRLVAEGKLGVKSGEGFYVYKGKL